MVHLKVRLNPNLKISNDIALNGKFTLSPLESKLLFALLALCPKNAETRESYTVDLINLVDWIKLSPIQLNRTIKKIIYSLSTKTVQILDHTTNKYVPYLWFQNINLTANESMISFTLDEQIYLLVQNITTNYMSTKVNYLMKFKKMYTTKIYFYCCCWKSLFIPRTITVKEFREKLDIGLKNKSFKDLKRNIIEPSIKEINTLTNLYVEVVFHQKRRRFDSMTFKIKQKEETCAIDTEQYSPQKIAVVERLAKEGVNEDGIMQVIDFSTIRINLNINYVLGRKNVKNKGAYIVKAIINDYACSYLIEENNEYVKVKTNEHIKEKIVEIWMNSSITVQKEAIDFIRNNIAPYMYSYLDKTIDENINMIPQQFTFTLSQFFESKGVVWK